MIIEKVLLILHKKKTCVVCIRITSAYFYGGISKKFYPLIEPCCEKTGLRGFWPGSTTTQDG